MSKRLILVLTFAFVLGIAFTARAEIQNIKVGGDLLIRGLARSEFELDEVNEKEDAILGAVRVRIDADLTDNVAACVRILNERDWGEESDSTNEMDLDLAYVTVKELLDSPVTLVVGRQELRYGNALIIGDPDTNAIATAASQLATSHTDLSLRKAFDAMKVILDYDPLVIDVAYAKIEENSPLIANDIDLYGLNANYMVNSDLLSELYFWSRDRSWGSTGMTTANLAGNGERLNVVGARGVYTGIENLTLGLEGAYQFGDHIASTTLYPEEARTTADSYKSKVCAYAIQLTSNYVFADMDYTPSVRFNYTRLSGDKDQSISDNYTGWSPMFEDQAGGTIFNKLVGYSNAQLFNVGTSVQPMEDLTVALDWYQIRILQTMNDQDLAAKSLNSSGTTYNVVNGKRHLADELDLNITYDYTEDVQFGLNTGVYFPGSVYAENNNEKPVQVIGSMKVTF